MQTLGKLHYSAGIAHLDVKPNNIMLTSDADSAWDKMRLIDFGLSVKSGKQTHNCGILFIAWLHAADFAGPTCPSESMLTSDRQCKLLDWPTLHIFENISVHKVVYSRLCTCSCWRRGRLP